MLGTTHTDRTIPKRSRRKAAKALPSTSPGPCPPPHIATTRPHRLYTNPGGRPFVNVQQPILMIVLYLAPLSPHWLPRRRAARQQHSVKADTLSGRRVILVLGRPEYQETEMVY